MLVCKKESVSQQKSEVDSLFSLNFCIPLRIGRCACRSRASGVNSFYLETERYQHGGVGLAWPEINK
jgi:hypothetical protein